MKKYLPILILMLVATSAFSQALPTSSDGYTVVYPTINRFNPTVPLNMQSTSYKTLDTIRGYLGVVRIDTTAWMTLPRDTSLVVGVYCPGYPDTLSLSFNVQYGCGGGFIDTAAVQAWGQQVTWLGWQVAGATALKYSKSGKVGYFQIPAGATHFRVFVSMQAAGQGGWQYGGKVRAAELYGVFARYRTQLNY